MVTWGGIVGCGFFRGGFFTPLGSFALQPLQVVSGPGVSTGTKKWAKWTVTAAAGWAFWDLGHNSVFERWDGGSAPPCITSTSNFLTVSLKYLNNTSIGQVQADTPASLPLHISGPGNMETCAGMLLLFDTYLQSLLGKHLSLPFRRV
jgi:hypothetical protein